MKTRLPRTGRTPRPAMALEKSSPSLGGMSPRLPIRLSSSPRPAPRLPLEPRLSPVVLSSAPVSPAARSVTSVPTLEDVGAPDPLQLSPVPLARAFAATGPSATPRRSRPLSTTLPEQRERKIQTNTTRPYTTRTRTRDEHASSRSPSTTTTRTPMPSESVSTRRARSPRGFWNMGRSCHLGATLAALAALPTFRAWACEQNSAIADALRASSGDIDDRVGDTSSIRHATSSPRPSGRRAYGQNSGSALDPRPAASSIESPSWRAHEAQDAHETLGRLVDALIKAREGARQLDRAPDPPPPLKGLTTVVRTCETCGASSDAILHSFSVLSLPLPFADRHLAPAIHEAFAGAETGIMARCDMCGTEEPHTRQHAVARFPKVLAVHLQKAYLCGGGTDVEASAYATVFPERLSLVRGPPVPVPQRMGYQRASDAESPTSDDDRLSAAAVRRRSREAQKPTGVVQYALKSVVHHLGGAGPSSHFVTTLSSTDSTPADGLAGLVGGSWWVVDDSTVRNCGRDRALNPRSAYMLFYEALPEACEA